jgi:CheY-like chemotaxis protein
MSEANEHPLAQRVLAVDDDKEIVRVLRAYLEQAGYVVFTACDGDTALRNVTLSGKVIDPTPTERPGYPFTRGELVQQRLGYDYDALERARYENGDIRYLCLDDYEILRHIYVAVRDH